MVLFWFHFFLNYYCGDVLVGPTIFHGIWGLNLGGEGYLNNITQKNPGKKGKTLGFITPILEWGGGGASHF